SLARSPKTFQTARHSIADEFDMASAVERLGPISNSQIDAHLPRSGGGASDRSADALRRASVGAAHRQFSVAGFSTPSARSPIQNHTSSGLAFMKRSAAASALILSVSIHFSMVESLSEVTVKRARKAAARGKSERNPRRTR